VWHGLRVAKKKARTESARTQRRAFERAEQSLAKDRQRLFELEVGGSAGRPIEVSSASVVETHALSVPCPLCSGPHEVVEHAAVVDQGVRLREVRLRCRQCGSRRTLFFRLVEPKPN
jgi:hypothetical protein